MTGLRIFFLWVAAVAATPMIFNVPPELQHTSWKAFYAKMPDTVIIHFENDTATVLSSMGSPVLQSTYKLKNDIITFHDFGGINACGQSGSYHVRINGDTLTLVVAEDPCDVRTGMLIIKPWIRKN